MRDLKTVQTNFQAYVLEHKDGIQTDVVSTEAVAVTTRLDIYRHGYRLRLQEVLEQDYPGLRYLLGEDAFQVMMQSYIAKHPSTFRSLRWYGDQLVSFLKTTEPYVTQPVLAEMALFEWMLMGAFDAADVPVATLATMAAIPPEQWAGMCFTLHPAVHQATFHWNIAQLWNSVEAAKPEQPVYQETPVNYLIWRRERDVQFCSVTPEEAYMLTAMAATVPFGDLCEGLCEWILPEEVALYAATVLKRFIVDGIVQAVHHG